MGFLTFEEFIAQSKSANIIPVYEDIASDMFTPLGLFLNIGEQDVSFLFESLEGGEKWGRYSFLGFGAQQVFTSTGKNVTITQNGREKRYISDDPFQEIKKFIRQFNVMPTDDMPRLTTGIIGFLGYEMVRFIEKLPDSSKPSPDFADSFFFLPDVLLVHDTLKQRLRVLVNVYLSRDDCPNLEQCYLTARKKLHSVIELLHRGHHFSMLPAKSNDSIPLEANVSREEFEEMVRKAKNHIISGDCIQIVLSQRFKAPVKTSPINVYRSLRQINPSPYLFYLKFGSKYLLGSSPEILVRLDENGIQLRPIAGTRPRGKTKEEDRLLEEQLLNDEKERAEHIMLVDLGRNDVGRVAELGSVRVDELMAVERYSHVMHIVSNVIGRLAPGIDAVDVLRAVFPAGTVSGAPKVRAMEIIEELEKERRGPYAGAVGYFDFSGNMDFCINIRSFFITNNQIYFQVGAGIVADSQPSAEFYETINKGKALIKALELAFSFKEGE